MRLLGRMDHDECAPWCDHDPANHADDCDDSFCNGSCLHTLSAPNKLISPYVPEHTTDVSKCIIGMDSQMPGTPIHCSRCNKEIEGSTDTDLELQGFTRGYYDVRSEYWAAFAVRMRHLSVTRVCGLTPDTWLYIGRGDGVTW
jgi:hypothetical protein